MEKQVVLGNGVVPNLASGCALCSAGHSSRCSCQFNCGHSMCYYHEFPIGENSKKKAK